MVSPLRAGDDQIVRQNCEGPSGHLRAGGGDVWRCAGQGRERGGRGARNARTGRSDRKARTRRSQWLPSARGAKGLSSFQHCSLVPRRPIFRVWARCLTSRHGMASPGRYGGGQGVPPTPRPSPLLLRTTYTLACFYLGPMCGSILTSRQGGASPGRFGGGRHGAPPHPILL